MDTAKMSDSEIITLNICGELLGIDSENAWYFFVKRNLRHLFPEIYWCTRFNRTRRALLQVTGLIRQKLAQSFPIPSGRYFVIDSFPHPVCKFGRARYCRSFRVDGANYERCPFKKRLILASRFMPWLPWRVISQLLRLPRLQWMTGRGLGILHKTAMVW